MNQKIKMLKRWTKIVLNKTNVSVHQGKGKVYSLDSVRGYYSDMTGKIEKGYRQDENGIPMTNIGERELVYFPIDIMNFGLAYYDMYLLHNKEEYLFKCINIVNWCSHIQKEDGAWDCFGPVKSSKYTVSSLGQGLGASLMIRAFLITSNYFYLQKAKSALDYMLLSLEEGGTSIYTEQDCYLEEYPQENRRSVLNGWIFSIFGIWDYYQITKEEKYWDIMIKTKDTLCKTLHQYDFSFWTYYDLKKMVASPHYQQLHFCLLEILYEMFHDEAFDLYSKRWRKQYNNLPCKIFAISIKITQKLFEKNDVVSID